MQKNLIGSYAWTQSTVNLIGSCNKDPNIQSHKDTYAHNTKQLPLELN